ncbi:D-alanine--D-alanine ligase [candidate division WOR-3 bacterium]|nr:D-alanine--D-alanine ligase [candidate division WOR-3 bacterium]
MKRKIRVGIIFGGRSAEHNVSLTSAAGILKAIDKKKFEVIPIMISKQGRWLSLTSSHSLLETSQKLLEDRLLKDEEKSLVLVGDPEIKGFVKLNDKTIQKLDIVFPILHGAFGEDGSVQGLMKLASLPCVGAGILASALGLDKIAMKSAFEHHNLPVLKYSGILSKIWLKRKSQIIDQIKKDIDFPCFIKPANTGSSVGISKAHNVSEIEDAMLKASKYDRKIIIEEFIDVREIECGVLGNDEPKASVLGEVVPCNEFYDYEAKYLLDGSKLIIPANLSPEKTKEIQELAIKAFTAIDCAGMARVDFFLEKKTQKVFVNEINTIPGFTPISMYPMLWEASGVPYSELITKLIDLALKRHRETKNLL